jgi:hypothetical protein
MRARDSLKLDVSSAPAPLSSRACVNIEERGHTPTSSSHEHADEDPVSRRTTVVLGQPGSSMRGSEGVLSVRLSTASRPSDPMPLLQCEVEWIDNTLSQINQMSTSPPAFGDDGRPSVRASMALLPRPFHALGSDTARRLLNLRDKAVRHATARRASDRGAADDESPTVSRAEATRAVAVVDECVDHFLRGRFSAAQSALLDPCERERTFTALAARYPPVAAALDAVSRRSLPYVAVPRQVLVLVDGARRAGAVAEALSLPCDSDTYASLHRLAEQEDRTAAHLIVRERVLTALCDALRDVNAGKYTGTEAMAVSRPGSPSASPRRCSGTHLARRALALWTALAESVKLCLTVGRDTGAFGEELVASRVLGVICHAVSGIGAADHRTLRGIAARLLRTLTVDEGVVLTPMLEAARAQVCRIAIGFPKIWGYLLPALCTQEPGPRTDVASSIVAMVRDDPLGHDVAVVLVGPAACGEKYIAAAFEKAAGDAADGASAVAMAALNAESDGLDAFLRTTADAACGRLASLLRGTPHPGHYAIVDAPADRRMVLAAMASSPTRNTCCIRVEPARASTSPTPESKQSARVDARAVCALAQFITRAMATPRAAAVTATAVRRCDDLLEALQDHLHTADGRSVRSRSGVVFGTLATLLRQYDAAPKRSNS